MKYLQAIHELALFEDDCCGCNEAQSYVLATTVHKLAFTKWWYLKKTLEFTRKNQQRMSDTVACYPKIEDRFFEIDIENKMPFI